MVSEVLISLTSGAVVYALCLPWRREAERQKHASAQTARILSAMEQKYLACRRELAEECNISEALEQRERELMEQCGALLQKVAEQSDTLAAVEQHIVDLRSEKRVMSDALQELRHDNELHRDAVDALQKELQSALAEAKAVSARYAEVSKEVEKLGWRSCKGLPASVYQALSNWQEFSLREAMEVTKRSAEFTLRMLMAEEKRGRVQSRLVGRKTLFSIVRAKEPVRGDAVAEVAHGS